jgi:hypothetical protein
MRTLFLNLVCPVADLSRLVLQLRSLLSLRQLASSRHPGTERERGLIYNLIIKETVKGFASRARCGEHSVPISDWSGATDLSCSGLATAF